MQPAPASPSAAPPAHANVDGALSSPRPAARAVDAPVDGGALRLRLLGRPRPRRRARRRDGGGDRRGRVHRRRGPRLRARPLRPRRATRAGACSRTSSRTSSSRSRARSRAGVTGREAASESTRRELETRFGAGLDDVRIHTGKEGRRVAGSHSALAVARGSDVFFASGAWAPGTALGDRLCGTRSRICCRQGVPVRPGPKPCSRRRRSSPHVARRIRRPRPRRARAAAARRRRSSRRWAACRGPRARSSSTSCGRARRRRGSTRTRRSCRPSLRTRPRSRSSGSSPRQQVQPLPAVADRRRRIRLRRSRAARAADAAAARDRARPARPCHERRDGPASSTGFRRTRQRRRSSAPRAVGEADRDAAGVRLVGCRRALAANAKEQEPAAIVATPIRRTCRRRWPMPRTRSRRSPRPRSRRTRPRRTSTSSGRGRSRVHEGRLDLDGRAGRHKQKLEAVLEQDAAQLLREVKAGTFEGQLQAVKKRVSDKTYIEIRGCNSARTTTTSTASGGSSARSRTSCRRSPRRCSTSSSGSRACSASRGGADGIHPSPSR